MNIQETLKKIDDIVDTYYSGLWSNTTELRTMLRELSCLNHAITSINIEAYKNWNSIIYNRQNKESVASAKVRADEEVSELRLSRKVLESTKNILLAMQQELSIMKKD